ncbi:hypothetical protein P7K49_039649, partial [Saguinus oedipus]
LSIMEVDKVQELQSEALSIASHQKDGEPELQTGTVLQWSGRKLGGMEPVALFLQTSRLLLHSAPHGVSMCPKPKNPSPETVNSSKDELSATGWGLEPRATWTQSWLFQYVDVYFLLQPCCPQQSP